jgi:hypothetical protein
MSTRAETQITAGELKAAAARLAPLVLPNEIANDRHVFSAGSWALRGRNAQEALLVGRKGLAIYMRLDGRAITGAMAIPGGRWSGWNNESARLAWAAAIDTARSAGAPAFGVWFPDGETWTRTPPNDAPTDPSASERDELAQELVSGWYNGRIAEALSEFNENHRSELAALNAELPAMIARIERLLGVRVTIEPYEL